MIYSKNNSPIKCIMKNSTCYKGTSTFTPKGILWHSTGVNNPKISRYVQPYKTDTNYNEMITLLGKNKLGNDWNHIKRNAGVNAWIGKLANGIVASVQTLEWNQKPWGCGSGSKGSCNNTHIQFEICEDGLNDRNYFEKAYKEACELTAYLCNMYNINPLGTFVYNGVTVPTILCHQDSYKLKLGSNHSDIYHWFKKHGKTMDDVRKDVSAIMNIKTNTTVTTKPTANTTSTTTTPFSIKVDKVNKGDVLNIRKEPNVKSDITGKLAYDDTNTYTIIEVKNGWGKLKSGLGWINLTYTKKVSATTSTVIPKPVVAKKPDVIYQVYSDGKWLSEIKNYNETNSNGYAGVFGKEISGIRVKLSNGKTVTVRSHLKGKLKANWLSAVTKWDNTNNGYSGVKGKPIDCITMKADGYTLKYRVHIKGGNWLSWVSKYDIKDYNSGLAGTYGKPIDAIQIMVV